MDTKLTQYKDIFFVVSVIASEIKRGATLTYLRKNDVLVNVLLPKVNRVLKQKGVRSNGDYPAKTVSMILGDIIKYRPSDIVSLMESRKFRKAEAVFSANRFGLYA